MKGLEKRVETLEQQSGEQQSGVQNKSVIWSEWATYGGLVHKGKLYPDKEALFFALGIKPGEVILFEDKRSRTAAEILREAEERAKNPPPEVTIDDLGEHGRSLVAEGCSPMIAQFLERLALEREQSRSES